MPKRKSDQKVFISDNSRAIKEFGWKPKISSLKGINSLYKWLSKNKLSFRKFY